MPFIENVAAIDIQNGEHSAPGENCVLIQIANPAGWMPNPKFTFKEIFQFEFLDVEHDNKDFEDEWKFSDVQAAEIAQILKQSLSDNKDVIINCHAGISRSGAVAVVGALLGFNDTGKFKDPNLMVKHKLMKALGLNFNKDEKSDPEAWRNFKI